MFLKKSLTVKAPKTSFVLNDKESFKFLFSGFIKSNLKAKEKIPYRYEKRWFLLLFLL